MHVDAFFIIIIIIIILLPLLFHRNIEIYITRLIRLYIHVFYSRYIISLISGSNYFLRSFDLRKVN